MIDAGETVAAWCVAGARRPACSVVFSADVTASPPPPPPSSTHADFGDTGSASGRSGGVTKEGGVWERCAEREESGGPPSETETEGRRGSTGEPSSSGACENGRSGLGPSAAAATALACGGDTSEGSAAGGVHARVADVTREGDSRLASAGVPLSDGAGRDQGVVVVDVGVVDGATAAAAGITASLKSSRVRTRRVASPTSAGGTMMPPRGATAPTADAETAALPYLRRSRSSSLDRLRLAASDVVGRGWGALAGATSTVDKGSGDENNSSPSSPSSSSPIVCTRRSARRKKALRFTGAGWMERRQDGGANESASADQGTVTFSLTHRIECTRRQLTQSQHGRHAVSVRSCVRR